MNIYEIKNELHNDKEIKKLRKEYKKNNDNDFTKIIVKKIDESGAIEENLAIVLEFWQKDVIYGTYKNDEIIITDYWQTKKTSLKNYNENDYNCILELTKKQLKWNI